ncbi:MAG: tetratricopeptide repeat protein [Thiobacillus sp.]|nr:tetratricopeptide repeat protein [Thiobacillus sp.]
MSDANLSPYVFDATPDNFQALVQGNSMKGLVLVHFWTAKAGPCMVLMPRLVRLASEYHGRFLLVMANTDALSRQAHSLGVTSVPTVKFFLHGQVVHTIHGAEPDSTFHEALGRYLASDQDAARMAALAAHQRGDTAGAIEQLARIAVEHPEDLAVAMDLAKLLTLSGRPGEALQLLTALPPAARQSPGIAPLLAHLELIDAAQNGPEDAAARLSANPGDEEARLTLAARALFDEAPQTALEHLLELARTAPAFREDLGRRALLALFGMLGTGHPLTRHYRSALAALNA